MADFYRIGSQTPLLSNLKPHGKVKYLLYHTAQKFGGKKHWRVWCMKLHLPTIFLPNILINLLKGMRQNCNT